jgi:hypothetical protein
MYKKILVSVSKIIVKVYINNSKSYRSVKYQEKIVIIKGDKYEYT